MPLGVWDNYPLASMLPLNSARDLYDNGIFRIIPLHVSSIQGCRNAFSFHTDWRAA